MSAAAVLEPRALAELDAILVATRCFGGGNYAGWTLDLAVVGPLALALAAYASGAAALWRRAGVGHGARLQEVGCFACGWSLMAIALVTPLHVLSRELFSAHMIEHELVMLGAAPLLVLSRPYGVMLWAFPPEMRRGTARLLRAPAVAGVLRWLSLPMVATAWHALAVWSWHVPSLFDAALGNDVLHWLQHASFFLSALFLWRAILLPPRRSQLLSVGLLFLTGLHTSLLGALLTFSPALWYEPAAAASAWRLDALEDQQLAGLIMWIPGGLIYVVAGLALLGAKLTTPHRESGEYLPEAS
jgi:cytochrome c oxidase assembly factor CtaG